MSNVLRMLLFPVRTLKNRVHPLKDLHKVKLDWITQHPEQVIARHARVSTKNPDRKEYIGLLKHCIREGHVSVFEQVCASFEIYTSRSLSPQLLRHRSFSFQEASQRYCNPLDVLEELSKLAPEFELRAQDYTNRQNSIEYDNDLIEEEFRERIRHAYSLCSELYTDMVSSGVARECARNILPLCVPTRLHMQGTLRSWMFFVGVRSAPGTQKEHKHISNQIGQRFRALLPDIIEAVVEASKNDASLGLRGWQFIDSI